MPKAIVRRSCRESPCDDRHVQVMRSAAVCGVDRYRTSMREPTLPHFSESCSECRLRASDLFPNVDFGTVATSRTYAPGETIFHEGDEPRGAYIIDCGVVRLMHKTGVSREPFVKIARAGDALSIAPLLTGGTHAVSAEAVDPTRVQFIERRAVLRLFAADIGQWQRTLDAVQRTHRTHPRSVSMPRQSYASASTSSVLSIPIQARGSRRTLIFNSPPASSRSSCTSSSQHCRRQPTNWSAGAFCSFTAIASL